MSNTQLFSPYKATQIISERLGYVVRPQQVYGLIRNNPELQRKNELGHLVVDEQFITKYVEDRLAKAAKKAEKNKEEVA